MQTQIRPVAIVGSARIPFARAYTVYKDVNNLQMLSAALEGLVQAHGLKGQHIGEVVGGAVVNQQRFWNLAREAVLHTSLAPSTPGITMSIACGTSLQAALQVGAKIATGQIDSGIACGVDSISDSPFSANDRFAKRLVKASRAKTLGQKLGALKGFSFAELLPSPPSTSELATGLSMGDHTELMAKTWDISREDQDAWAHGSHQKAAAAYADGFHDDLIVPCEGVWQDNNIRFDSSLEAMAKLKPAYDKRSGQGTLTAGNSTPLTDGASSLLLASEDWAKERGLPILAYLTGGDVAANNFVAGDGLLMAPTIALGRLLARQERSLGDFDLVEIHEAFAAQVLATLKALQDGDYCREHLGRDAPLGEIEADRINPKGSSLAYGHPFAATGARILGGTAKQLATKGGDAKALISVCTAGGMGVVASVEAA